MSENIKVEIVEQPATNKLRFRYPCEGKSAGSIPGINSTAVNRRYPAIRVLNYSGQGVVVVSCVTKDRPYKPHPHSLVGKDCSKGVCKIEFTTDSSNPTILTFPNLGIHCVKIKEIEKALKERENLRVDPFKTGFKHKDSPKSIHLNMIRLCFQVLLRNENHPTKFIPLKPIVSNTVYDKKYVTDLLIFDISDTTSPSSGGKKIMIFCEKVMKEDIKIRFFESNSAWEDWAIFDQTNVHRQTAISFKTPKYKFQDIYNPVNVFIQMERPSDKARSEPLPFQYVRDVSNVALLVARKRSKIENGTELFETLQTDDEYQQLKYEMDRYIDPNRTFSRNIPATGNTSEDQRRSIAANFDFPTHGQFKMEGNPGNGLSTNYNPYQYNPCQYNPYQGNPVPNSMQISNWNTYPVQAQNLNSELLFNSFQQQTYQYH